ncbi:hypothetical protein AOX55_00006802 (plasmid) [Sinorhizobium fredii CCBAU 25509]|nr:hypothetical protein SF83666_b68520 [Sinorhizobium fredii CCBAU 83666]AWM29577.1 hypothetical protein AOX55_00006802 [Sinorhizobium fredii CCBAU 25509]
MLGKNRARNDRIGFPPASSRRKGPPYGSEVATSEIVVVITPLSLARKSAMSDVSVP